MFYDTRLFYKKGSKRLWQRHRKKICPKNTRQTNKRTTAKRAGAKNSSPVYQDVIVLVVLAVSIVLFISNFGIGESSAMRSALSFSGYSA